MSFKKEQKPWPWDKSAISELVVFCQRCLGLQPRQIPWHKPRRVILPFHLIAMQSCYILCDEQNGTNEASMHECVHCLLNQVETIKPVLNDRILILCDQNASMYS